MTMKNCIACHDSMKKSMSPKLHLKHADKAPCESCHALQGAKLVVKPGAKTIGNLSESDWSLYQELFEGFAEQTNAVKLHMEKGLLCRDGSVRISVSGEVIPGATQRGCPLYLRCSMPDLMR